MDNIKQLNQHQNSTQTIIINPMQNFNIEQNSEIDPLNQSKHNDHSNEHLITTNNHYKQKNFKKLVIMLVLVSIYCIAEMYVGYSQNCLSLVADSFHMFSDGLSLLVALYGIKLALKGSHQKWSGFSNTFGWGRSEVLSTLVNAVFLTALCLTILLSAIERIVSPEEIKRPKLVFYVGIGGLIVNIIGLIMLQGDHGHSHDNNEGHGHTHATTDKSSITELTQRSLYLLTSHDNIPTSNKNESDHANMNMRAVFLHVFGDFLGSIVVILTSGCLYYFGCENVPKLDPNSSFVNMTVKCLQSKSNLNQPCINTKTGEQFESYFYGCFKKQDEILYFSEPHWLVYIDPVCSLLLVVILLTMTLPLLKGPITILLQTVPSDVNQDDLCQRILYNPNVCSIHCLHLWRFDGKTIIASCHLVVKDLTQWSSTAKEINQIFASLNIYSVTIQPELFRLKKLTKEDSKDVESSKEDDFKNSSISKTSIHSIQDCVNMINVNIDSICCNKKDIYSSSISDLKKRSV